jgi:uncharacterized protein YjbI with pentapeptide repeats
MQPTLGKRLEPTEDWKQMVIRQKIDTMSDLIIEKSILHGHSYAGTTVATFTAIESTFEACDFRRMTMHRACFGAGTQRSIFSDCVFDGSKIRASAPGIARFERCSFLDTHFLELNCRNVEFVDCVFSGRIDQGYFNGSIAGPDAPEAIQKLSFSGNDFGSSELVDVGFRSGIDLSKQKLPTGNQYFFSANAGGLLNKLRELVLDASEEDAKSIGILMKIIDRERGKGQDQVFLNMDGFPQSYRTSFALIRNAAT